MRLFGDRSLSSERAIVFKAHQVMEHWSILALGESVMIN
jgi:hypothetical protein